jgi:alkylhydroperoxidase family enzyme
MRVRNWFGFVIMSGLAAGQAPAGDPAPPLMKTRPEMKSQIEALKNREARIALPSLTPEEIAAGKRSANNGRLRSIYLPESWLASRGAQQQPSGPGATNNPPAPASTGVPQSLGDRSSGPEYAFRKRLFWIVSRTNDCQYCLGHQELALRRSMSDDEIAALDCNWSIFPAEEQAAMQFARKLTLTPHLMDAADVSSLQKHFSDERIFDIVQTLAGNNSTNRWTDSTGIPQDRSNNPAEPRQLDTPTSTASSQLQTKVAPVDYVPRPAWEPRSEVEQAMAACRDRASALKLPDVEVAQRILAAETPGVVPPNWFRAASYFPTSALRLWKHRQALVRDGRLDPRLKALIAWVCAREDRAWYAAAHARARLNSMEIGDDLLFSIGDEQKEAAFSEVERQVFAFARKLTSAPHTIVDSDVATLRKSFSDHEVAEIIFLTCDANSFDRLTEALRLPLEGGVGPVATAQVSK